MTSNQPSIILLFDLHKMLLTRKYC